jgi:hypothetical protein
MISLDFLFNPEDGSGRFLPNLCWLLTHYMALNPEDRTLNPSKCLHALQK